MGTHMKTTIDIADTLLREAKAVAAREQTTVRALVEQGLRLAIEGRRPARRFKLRPVTFKGDGLRPGVSLESWDQIRDLVYEGRGT